jgi:demethylmenaquinone methyltransferase / 2-methoxy-6-polyprenyl-1,4-benzoquinol methylase
METMKDDKRPLQKMFRAVPPSYDLLNRVLTFGLDEPWRKKAAAACLANNPASVMDLCCGTGDLVMHLGKAAPPGTIIKALDYSQPMLDIATKKAVRKNLPGIVFIHGDAASMPFPDNHFDSIGIAFAFRNLTFRNPDSQKFLSEILRVLKPGGRFVVVETSQPPNKLLRRLYHLYLKWITAPVGGILSGHSGAYKYLAHSARLYYNQVEMEELLGKSGFRDVTSSPLLGGIAAVFVAERPPEVI